MLKRLARLLVAISAAATLTAALAQAEPTLDQVYKAAQAGQLIQAQEMMKQVLANHPKSGKAHYVEAELLARQGLGARAREELALAESLAPGLPFAKPAAVQALRAEISPVTDLTPRGSNVARESSVAPSQAPAPSFPWGMALGFAALAGAVYVFVLSRRKAAPAAPAAYAGSAGPTSMPAQPMGMNPGAAPYSPYGAAAPAPAPGMGSRIAGGVATGLAVGAGVMAAEAIGRNLFGPDHHDRAAPQSAQDSFKPLDQNADMGGNDFGVNDAGSWDDGGGSDGGGSWD
ncbi:MAG: tetratricopeptide repeat protein [Burkholderiales bacterium]|nr:tetratricopeptide repeat protein [Burkholderiales bacterium]